MERKIGEQVMNLGKASKIVLQRSVFNRIKHRREEVVSGAAIAGGTAVSGAVLAVAENEVIFLSMNPVFGAVEGTGFIAVHAVANGMLSQGAQMIGIMPSILLPEGSSESLLRSIVEEMERVCAGLQIEIIGGDTQVSRAVNQPVITVAGIGKKQYPDVHRKDTIEVKPGQEIVMTKWAGLEGTGLLARRKREELIKRYSKSYLEGAEKMLQDISIRSEAEIALSHGVKSISAVSSGGVFGALWDLGDYYRMGLEVDLKKIPLKQETVEICEFFDLNPYTLCSEGCMLMVTDKANLLVDDLRTKGIAAEVIGSITENNDRVILNDGERRFLEPSRSEEIYKVL